MCWCATAGGYGTSGSAREGGQEPVAEAVHPPYRGLFPGLEAVLPAPPGDPVQHCLVAGDDGDRHVVAGLVAGDDRGGLVVAEEHEHEIVVAELLHIRDEA